MGGGQWKLTHPHLASWAVLRAARLAGRPGHADQLHVDIWRDGRNLALDPGAYRYNAPPPWDNALRQAQVHNTVTIDHLDQMQAAGRFLYLHRAQAEVLQVGETSLTAQHNGYRTLGLIHRRTLSAEPNGWRVIDEVLFASLRHARRSAGRPRHVAVQWLFPDAAWRLDGQVVRLDTPTGVVSVTLACDWPAALQIVRAGVSLFGSPHVQPIWGWYSPTYSVKIPGLCLRWVVQAPPPLTLVSHITLEGLSPG